MLKNSRRTWSKEEELLMGVARSIGSTLGTIVAKVSPPKALNRHSSRARRRRNKENNRSLAAGPAQAVKETILIRASGIPSILIQL